ncbi:MAG: hypothetical protein M1118_13315 [Chloroflexi bacterium]|nr:hypothetical protein [Chloroflexota bacterium]
MNRQLSVRCHISCVSPLAATAVSATAGVPVVPSRIVKAAAHQTLRWLLPALGLQPCDGCFDDDCSECRIFGTRGRSGMVIWGDVEPSIPSDGACFTVGCLGRRRHSYELDGVSSAQDIYTVLPAQDLALTAKTHPSHTVAPQDVALITLLLKHLGQLGPSYCGLGRVKTAHFEIHESGELVSLDEVLSRLDPVQGR